MEHFQRTDKNHSTKGTDGTILEQNQSVVLLRHDANQFLKKLPGRQLLIVMIKSRNHSWLREKDEKI